VSIVLIGAPASGKTRVGKRLARRLDKEFIDTDRVIVAQNGPIAEIFEREGEEHFRILERAAVREALARPAVVSVGGGAVLHPDTQSDLTSATVILLTISAEAAAARIGDGKRPLINGLDSWKRITEARAPLYASLADFTIDTSSQPIELIVDDIAQWVEGRL
jgi:shikimate kinase